MISIILTLIVVILGGLHWRKVKQLKESRANEIALVEEMKANDDAWEKGQDDLVELYGMQILTLQERLEEAETSACDEFFFRTEATHVLDDITRVANERMAEIYRLRPIVKLHEESCLPRLG